MENNILNIELHLVVGVGCSDPLRTVLPAQLKPRFKELKAYPKWPAVKLHAPFPIHLYGPYLHVTFLACVCDCDVKQTNKLFRQTSIWLNIKQLLAAKLHKIINKSVVELPIKNNQLVVFLDLNIFYIFLQQSHMAHG